MATVSRRRLPRYNYQYSTAPQARRLTLVCKSEARRSTVDGGHINAIINGYQRGIGLGTKHGVTLVFFASLLCIMHGVTRTEDLGPE